MKGFAIEECKKFMFGGNKVLTINTMAKNVTRRIGDRLFLLTGHSSFKKRPGNGSQTPWIVQLSLMISPNAAITIANSRGAPAARNHRPARAWPRPRAAPAVNRNCQARGLKYQACPSG